MTLLRSVIYFDICLIILYIPSLIADKFCGKPPDVKNGEAILEAFSTEFPVGANIGYRCFDGFVLNTIGNSYAVCLSDNETTYWQPAVISCEPEVCYDCSFNIAVCNHWPSLQNGRLKLGGRTPPFMPGDSIEYVCDAGFTPSRIAAKVTCTVQEGIANWTETENACKLISCNDPGYIENAQRLGSVFTFPNNVTYLCNEGYKLIGPAMRYCSPKGDWLPNSPPSYCEAIVCPILSHPLNGKVISSQRRLHAVATYECDRYFNLSGNSERICQEDGTWSGDMPTCKEITCFDPGAIQHGSVIPNRKFYKAGDLIIFKCKYGFHQTSSKCLETGDWSKRPPLCPGPSTTESSFISSASPDTYTSDELNIVRKADCDDPGEIKNGVRIIGGLTINSTITYACEKDYELRGKAILLCKENGKWDLDKLPICVKPLSTKIPSIIGIVCGVLLLVALGVGGYFWYRWREKKMRGYGDKSKALTADATDLEEITGLDSGKKPIPVTVL